MGAAIDYLSAPRGPAGRPARARPPPKAAPARKRTTNAAALLMSRTVGKKWAESGVLTNLVSVFGANESALCYVVISYQCSCQLLRNHMLEFQPTLAGAFGHHPLAESDISSCLISLIFVQIVVESLKGRQVKDINNGNRKTNNFIGRSYVGSMSGQKSKLQVSTTLTSEPSQWRGA